MSRSASDVRRGCGCAESGRHEPTTATTSSDDHCFDQPHQSPTGSGGWRRRTKLTPTMATHFVRPAAVTTKPTRRPSVSPASLRPQLIIRRASCRSLLP